MGRRVKSARRTHRRHRASTGAKKTARKHRKRR